MSTGSTRSYRCTYFPTDRFGSFAPCESGVLPHVQVQAASAEQARQLAFATVGCPIAEVQRIEPPPVVPAAPDGSTRNLLTRAHIAAQALRFAEATA